jgi:hypothetical protein
MNRKATLAVVALALCSITGSTSANDSLSSRAIGALGMAIASQGDAALNQIRRELEQSALAAMKPFLPKPEQAPEHTQPAKTPAAQH